jgi:hemophore-related protein
MKATKVIGSIIGSGAAAIAVLAGSGAASAAPNIEAIVYSTCTYPQVMAALNATSPEMAANFQASPVADQWLQGLIAAGPEQRRQMIAQVQTIPGIQTYTNLINQVATSCQNF